MVYLEVRSFCDRKFSPEFSGFSRISGVGLLRGAEGSKADFFVVMSDFCLPSINASELGVNSTRKPMVPRSGLRFAVERTLLGRDGPEIRNPIVEWVSVDVVYKLPIRYGPLEHGKNDPSDLRSKPFPLENYLNDDVISITKGFCGCPSPSGVPLSHRHIINKMAQGSLSPPKLARFWKIFEAFVQKPLWRHWVDFHIGMTDYSSSLRTHAFSFLNGLMVRVWKLLEQRQTRFV